MGTPNCRSVGVDRVALGVRRRSSRRRRHVRRCRARGLVAPPVAVPVALPVAVHNSSRSCDRDRRRCGRGRRGRRGGRRRRCRGRRGRRGSRRRRGRDPAELLNRLAAVVCRLQQVPPRRCKRVLRLALRQPVQVRVAQAGAWPDRRIRPTPRAATDVDAAWAATVVAVVDGRAVVTAPLVVAPAVVVAPWS